MSSASDDGKKYGAEVTVEQGSTEYEVAIGSAEDIYDPN